MFQGDDFKYKIQYKSSKFEYNKNNNEYICPFIFAGSYIIEGNGYLLVAALGKNIYKNGKIYFDMLNDKEENINNNNQDSKDNDFDEYEYYKEVGYYKINISFFSERIASFGMCIFVFIGFILIVKDGILKKIENKSIMSLDYLYDVLNIIIFILIGSLLAVPNSLNMIDFVSYLSDEKIMEKNNIDIKYKKYPELAHIDTLIIFDNNNIIENNKKEEISKVIKNIKNCGINIILVTDKDFEQSLVYGKELGIIDIWEFNNAQKIVNKYIELNRKKSICIESEFFNYLYGKIDIEQKNNGQKKVKFANIKYFKNLMANFKILSKVKNDDKLILLTGLRNMEQKICIVGATMDDLSLLKMVNISFGMSTDVDALKENYSLTLLDNSFIAFWKSYILSCNLNYKINQYMNFFTITFYTSLLINIIGLFYCKNILLNKYIIIYLKIIVDIITPYLISQENTCEKLIVKNINKCSSGYLSIIFKILLRGLILIIIMIKRETIFNNKDIGSESGYDIWNDKNGFYVSVLFFILLFMIIIHLVIIIIKSKLNMIKAGIYVCFIVMSIFFVIYSEIFKVRLLSQNVLIKCFGFALLVAPFDLVI